MPALYFPYNSQSECQLDPYGLLVALEQHRFELCWVPLYSASLHQLRSSLQNHTVEAVDLEDREEPCIRTVGTYGGPTMSHTQNWGPLVNFSVILLFLKRLGELLMELTSIHPGVYLLYYFIMVLFAFIFSDPYFVVTFLVLILVLIALQGMHSYESSEILEAIQRTRSQ